MFLIILFTLNIKMNSTLFGLLTGTLYFMNSQRYKELKKLGQVNSFSDFLVYDKWSPFRCSISLVIVWVLLLLINNYLIK